VDAETNPFLSDSPQEDFVFLPEHGILRERRGPLELKARRKNRRRDVRRGSMSALGVRGGELPARVKCRRFRGQMARVTPHSRV
jgi:hypothetical protein